MESCAQTEPVSTILVIDDEPIICRLLSGLLSRQGWQVLTSLDPREALEILMAEPVSLVISDIQMPHLDGLKLVGMAKAAKPKVPILLMTGNSSCYSAEEALKSGADGYVTKPFRQPELIERIEKLLRCQAATT